MRKKLLTVVFAFFVFSSAAYSQTTRVESLQNFSTKVPATVFKVKTLEDIELENSAILREGAIITGSVVHVSPAKRGKRNAYFEFVPTSVSTEKGTFLITTPRNIAKVVGYAPIDPDQIIGNVAKTAAGFILTGASQGISFIQGASEAKEGSKIKSGFAKVYKDSPLSYIEEGNDLLVKPGDVLTVKFKKIKNIPIN